MQNLAPIEWGIRPGAGRAVLTDEVNSGSRSGPPVLCPAVAQGRLGPAGASPFRVAVSGRFWLRGVGHVALSRRTPYRVLPVESCGQPANKRMDLSERGAGVAAPHLSLGRALQVMRGR